MQINKCAFASVGLPWYYADAHALLSPLFVSRFAFFLPCLPPRSHTFNSRNMCVFLLHRPGLSCWSLSHACEQKSAQIHTEVLSSGKGLKLCTSPTSLTLCAQEHTITEVQFEDIKGTTCSHVGQLNNKFIWFSLFWKPFCYHQNGAECVKEKKKRSTVYMLQK